MEIPEAGIPIRALAVEVLSVPSLLTGLVVGLIPLSRFVGLVLPSNGPNTFLKVGCGPVVEGKGKVVLIDGLFGEVERLEARELGREENARGLRGVALGVEGRDWFI